MNKKIIRTKHQKLVSLHPNYKKLCSVVKGVELIVFTRPFLRLSPECPMANLPEYAVYIWITI